MISFQAFARIAAARDLVAVDHGNGHWRLRGGAYEVNWYPFSKRSSLYVAGMAGSIRETDAHRVIAAAFAVPGAAQRKEHDRKRSYRSMRRALFAKGPKACHWCAKPLTFAQTTTDHVIPLSKGGGNGLDNLRLACHDCNRRRGNEIGQHH